MGVMKDKMIDKMNADQEAEIAKRIKTGRRCLNCAYNNGPTGCPESSGENDYCDYFSIPANKSNNEN